MKQQPERLNEFIGFNVTPEEKKVLFYYSERNGITLSSFIRQALFEKISKEVKDDVREIQER